MSISFFRKDPKGTRTSQVASSNGQSDQSDQSSKARLLALIAEISRTGTLSESSLRSVTSDPSQFSQEEMRVLIQAIDLSSQRYYARANGYSAGGAILNAA